MLESLTIGQAKKLFHYGLGILLILAGLGGVLEGGMGLLSGLIFVATGLFLFPKTRPLLINAVKSAGGPDFSTIGRGTFIGIIVVGLIIGGALAPAADSPSTDTPQASTGPSDSTDTPDSPSGSSSDDTDSTSGSSTDDDSPDSDSEPSTDDESSSEDITGTTSNSSANDNSDSTSDSSSDEASNSDSPDSSTDSDQETSWTVTVLSVTDGDTMDVRMPDGSTDTIRLLGVDTPETSVGNTQPSEWDGIPDNTEGREWLEQWGSEASNYAEERLGGQEIYIEVDSESDRRGTYNRLLVYAYQSKSSSKSFNLRLIENGYARMYDSQFTKRSEYESAELEARNSNIGVWDYSESSTPSSGSSGDSNLVVSNIHADAAGNDHENLNDEYIELTNEGSSSIDMTSWTLSDDADHSYYFPSGFELGSDESVTIYTGSGSDSNSQLYWDAGSAVWNNGGDTIIVTNADSETVINHEY